MSAGESRLKDWFSWAIKGDYEKIKENSYIYARRTTDHDMTALMYAAVYGHVEIVKVLSTLEEGIRNSYGFTALMLSVLRDDVEPFQMTPDDMSENTLASINRRYDYETRKKHRREIMMELVDGELYIRDPRGRTALMLAVEHGNRDAVEFLLSKGGEMTTDCGWNPLMHSIIHQNVHEFDRYYEAYNTKRNLSRQTPLMQAAMMGNAYMVGKLLDINSKKQDVRGLTALMYAAKVNEVEIVNILKEKESTITDKMGMTALMYATSRGFSDIVSNLKDYECKRRDLYGWSALIYACLSNSVQSALLLRQEESDITDKSGTTALMYAAVLNRVDIIHTLMDTLILKTDDDGTTALMHAAVFNRTDVVRILVNYEAKLTDSNGLTALHHAVTHNHIEVVKLLLPSENFMKDLRGVTALYRAIELGYLGLVQVLGPVEKDGPLPTGWTRLMVCAIANKVDCFSQYIYEARSFIPSGETALILAVQYSTVVTIQALLQYEATLPNNRTGRTSLMYAAAQGREDVVPLLLLSEKMMQDKEGLTATMIAVISDNNSVLKALLTVPFNNGQNAAPFEVGMKDIYGQTALMKAALLGNRVAVQMLLPYESGLQDWNDRCAIMYAQNKGNTEIVSMLLPFESNIRDKLGNTYQSYKTNEDLDFKVPMEDILSTRDHKVSAMSKGARLDSIQEESADIYKDLHADENTGLTSFSTRRNDIVDDDHQSIVRIGFSIDGNSHFLDIPKDGSNNTSANPSNMKQGVLLENTTDVFDQHSLGTPRAICEPTSSRLKARVSSLLTESPHVEAIDTSLQILSKHNLNKLNKIDGKNELADLDAYIIEPNTSLTDPTTSQSLVISNISSKKALQPTTNSNKEGSQAGTQIKQLGTISENDSAKFTQNTIIPQERTQPATEFPVSVSSVPIVDAPINIPYALIRENNVIFRIPVHSGVQQATGAYPPYTLTENIVQPYQQPPPQQVQQPQIKYEFPPFPTIPDVVYPYMNYTGTLQPTPQYQQQFYQTSGFLPFSTQQLSTPSEKEYGGSESKITVMAKPCKHIFTVSSDKIDNRNLTLMCPICNAVVVELISENDN